VDDLAGLLAQGGSLPVFFEIVSITEHNTDMKTAFTPNPMFENSYTISVLIQEYCAIYTRFLHRKPIIKRKDN
jgi:hypothetical protein